MLWRVRLSAFVSGFAVAGVAGATLLHDDLKKHNEALLAQGASFERRLAQLEEAKQRD